MQKSGEKMTAQEAIQKKKPTTPTEPKEKIDVCRGRGHREKPAAQRCQTKRSSKATETRKG